MANFKIKTIKEIYDELIAKYTVLRNKYGDTSPLLERAAIKSLCWAFAGVCGTLWQMFLWCYKQCFPQTADLPALEFWGNLVGVKYKDGQAASLTIKLENCSAKILSAGTIYKDLATGLIFKTVSQSVNNNGVIIATAACTTKGIIGNLESKTALNIANPLDGIPSTATVDSVSISGSEDEKVEDYRKRVLYRFRNKSGGGNPFDYFSWVTEVPGIVDALLYVFIEGTVTIFPVAAGSGKNRTPGGTLNPNPFPIWENGQFRELQGSGQMLAVAKSIEGEENIIHNRRPTLAKVELRVPVYTDFEIEIIGLTDTSYNEIIKNTLVSALDTKRPHIKVIGYDITNAKINKPQLSVVVSSVIENATFASFILRKDGVSIDETILGIGCLANLSSLIINGENIPLEE